MMAVLEQLEPKKVFRFFEEMSAIPRGSGNTQAVSDWCAAFARERGLKHRQDALGNVVIWKDGTSGYEHAAPVILQGHMDMVCAQEAGCTKDMAREGLDLFVEGDLIGAHGTTLGGDNGIAVAMVMALLDSDDVPHPPIEAVFTVDEETGLLGAAGLDTGDLAARRLINLDSEEEGILTVSCAGGNRTECVLPVSRAPFAGMVLRVTLDELAGGHSGAEIHKGSANACVQLGRILRALQGAAALRLVRVDGGEKDNAIARFASAVLVTENEAALRAAAAEAEAALKREFRLTDPALRVRVEAAENAQLPMDENSTRRVLCLLHCAPNGVQAMSGDIEGLVQTSLNFGILSTDGDAVTASFSVRSSVASQKALLVDRLRCLSEALGGSVSTWGDYPAWEYVADSPLRACMVDTWRELTGEEPRVEAIHAGLECGLFAGKLPGLDCVSCGPTMYDIHTYHERLSISSVRRTWEYLCAVLKRLN